MLFIRIIHNEAKAVQYLSKMACLQDGVLEYMHHTLVDTFASPYCSKSQLLTDFLQWHGIQAQHIVFCIQCTDYTLYANMGLVQGLQQAIPQRQLLQLYSISLQSLWIHYAGIDSMLTSDIIKRHPLAHKPICLKLINFCESQWTMISIWSGQKQTF